MQWGQATSYNVNIEMVLREVCEQRATKHTILILTSNYYLPTFIQTKSIATYSYLPTLCNVQPVFRVTTDFLILSTSFANSLSYKRISIGLFVFTLLMPLWGCNISLTSKSMHWDVACNLKWIYISTRKYISKRRHVYKCILGTKGSFNLVFLASSRNFVEMLIVESIYWFLSI